jgi:hypothetical protein
MSRPAAAAAAVLAVVALSGCQTTEQESAAIAKRDAGQHAGAPVTQIAKTNATVRIDRAQIVHSASGTAAAIELTNKSSRIEIDLPILITVKDAAGKSLYTNATVGTSSPSGELALLGAHATVWWVDPNVLASAGTPASLSVRIGVGAQAAQTPPPLAAVRLASGTNFVGAYIGGRARNSSASTASQVTVYAVALSGGRVVAAGQSLIPTLAPHAATAFQVTVIGSTKGAQLAATIVPGRPG